MKIDSSGLHPSRKAGQVNREAPQRPEAEPGREPVTDDVSVSLRAHKLSLGRTALQAVPDVREGGVDAARARLSSGSEATDGRAIARAMIDTISGESA